jgi:2-polyprenyl-6-methoxyphenol hydroxylase-like FAD-dependent oxidoreductase
MSEHYDVVQIGFGPVGQTFAALLGQSGHRVGAFERSPECYPLPRAGHVDHEIMRIFQSISAADHVEKHAIPIPDYDWFNGAGELLLHFDWNAPAPSGWKSDYLIYQPYVEDALMQASARFDTVSVHHGWEAVDLIQHTDHVEVSLREGHRQRGMWEPTGRTRTVTADYVIGADGANSFVRRQCELNWVDFGFSEDWLVLDVRPNDPDSDSEIGLPEAAQICDPARPRSLFRWLGREHCRGEFMLLPGESAEQMVEPSVAWGLLEPYGLTEDNAQIVRRTVYTFRSLLADSFRRNRALLIGDAAHLMPPFMGQGMCSGLRDAKNLAWKLDLVLTGTAAPALLDTYTTERRPHAHSVIDASMELGRIICIADPQAAAERDAAFMSGQVPPPPPFPGLTDGILHRSATGSVEGPVGQLSVQGRVLYQNTVGRLDDLLGSGWTLLSRKADPQQHLNDQQRDFLTSISVQTLHVTRATMPDGTAAVDLDATYARWFADLNAESVLVRPDYYIFGVAETLKQLPDLVDSLSSQLPIRHDRSFLNA